MHEHTRGQSKSVWVEQTQSRWSNSFCRQHQSGGGGHSTKVKGQKKYRGWEREKKNFRLFVVQLDGNHNGILYSRRTYIGWIASKTVSLHELVSNAIEQGQVPKHVYAKFVFHSKMAFFHNSTDDRFLRHPPYNRIIIHLVARSVVILQRYFRYITFCIFLFQWHDVEGNPSPSTWLWNHWQ